MKSEQNWTSEGGARASALVGKHELEHSGEKPEGDHGQIQTLLAFMSP